VWGERGDLSESEGGTAPPAFPFFYLLFIFILFIFYFFFKARRSRAGVLFVFYLFLFFFFIVIKPKRVYRLIELVVQVSFILLSSLKEHIGK